MRADDEFRRRVAIKVLRPDARSAGLVKRFGGLVAVDNVDLSLERGTILGMIGINGAGKTTVMNCINGIYRSDAGRVRCNGRDITNLTPHEIAKTGVGRTFQVPRIFHRMTLIDNLMVTSLDSSDSDAPTSRVKASRQLSGPCPLEWCTKHREPSWAEAQAAAAGSAAGSTV